MALTFTPIEEAQLGNRKLWVGTVDLDAAYPTGGYDLKPIETGRHIVFAVCSGAYKTVFNNATQKLLVYNYPTSAGKGTQVSNGTNLGGETGYSLMAIME